MNDLCRREGIKPHSCYSWTKEFMQARGLPVTACEMPPGRRSTSSNDRTAKTLQQGLQGAHQTPIRPQEAKENLELLRVWREGHGVARTIAVVEELSTGIGKGL